jgi:iron complex transport system substrate-binding protein
VPVPSRPRALAALLAPLAALTLAACGGDAEGSSAGSTGSAEGTTISHSFGETAVPADPQRVVTWGWGSADAAVALGVVPVAMPHQSYGGDEQGVLPWLRERLEADGEQVPTVLPDSQEVPLEAIAAADPDLVLAPYSGITQEEYAQLSQIAPTVAPPGEPWATPWRETVEIVGAALGRADEAEQLLADIDGQVAGQAEEHPQLAGTTVAMVWDTPDAFYVYKPADARVAFTEDLGLETAPAVEELASGDETFYYTLSEERLAELDSDVLVTYSDSAQTSEAFLSSAPAKVMEQVQRGSVAQVVGTELIAAVSPPTALSLTYGLEDYVDALAAAADRVG